MFTWSNNQECPTLEKLDRILVTKEWEDIFPQTLVTKLPREISDHNPSTGKCDKLPFIQFKFDLNWLRNLDFYANVEGFGTNRVELSHLWIKSSKKSS